MINLFLIGPLANALSTSAQVDENMPLLRDLVRRMLKRYPDLLDANVSVHTEDSSELARYKVLDGGHWFPNVVYAAHPLRPDHYLRLANFHDYLMDEKRAEFERIAIALGAKEIRIAEHGAHGRTSSFTADGAVPIKGVKVDFGAKAGHRSSEFARFSIEATFSTPKRAPYLPADLCWLAAEPTWRAMVDSRVGDPTLIRRRVTLSYKADFSITAELAAKVLGWGMTCGGSFTSMEQFEVDHEVEFYPYGSAS